MKETLYKKVVTAKDGTIKEYSYIKNYGNQKKICECGIEIDKTNYAKHTKTKKHEKRLEEINNVEPVIA